MHIKCIVRTLGLRSRVAQQQEQLWSNPGQQLHQLCTATLGKSLRTILKHLLSQEQTRWAQQQWRCQQRCPNQRAEPMGWDPWAWDHHVLQQQHCQGNLPLGTHLCTVPSHYPELPRPGTGLLRTCFV